MMEDMSRSTAFTSRQAEKYRHSRATAARMKNRISRSHRKCSQWKFQLCSLYIIGGTDEEAKKDAPRAFSAHVDKAEAHK